MTLMGSIFSIIKQIITNLINPFFYVREILVAVDTISILTLMVRLGMCVVKNFQEVMIQKLETIIHFEYSKF